MRLLGFILSALGVLLGAGAIFSWLLPGGGNAFQGPTQPSLIAFGVGVLLLLIGWALLRRSRFPLT